VLTALALRVAKAWTRGRRQPRSERGTARRQTWRGFSQTGHTRDQTALQWTWPPRVERGRRW